MTFMQKLFGTEGANPDAQKKLIIKGGAIVLGALVVIIIVIRAISGSANHSNVLQPNKRILKTNEEMTKSIQVQEEYSPTSSKEVISSKYQSSLSDSFTDMNEEGMPETNGRFQEKGLPRNSNGGSRVDALLTREFSKDQSLNSQYQKAPKVVGINAYDYTYNDGDGKIERSYLSPDWKRTLSSDYAQVRKYLDNGDMIVFNDASSSNQRSPKVEKDIQRAEERREPMQRYSGMRSFPAGTILKAVTVDIINSDYPSISRARITSPAEIAGSIVLLNTATNMNDRVQVKVDKIVYNNSTFTINSVVKSGLPNLNGNINRHMARRTLNPLAAAGLIAYGTVFANNAGTNINTADVIRGSLIDQGMNLGINELNKYSGDIPNTITVPIGQPFEILLVDELVIK